MSATDVLKAKLKAFREENPNASVFAFAMNVWRGAWRVFMAKVYLRGCKVGKLVSVNGRPVVDNQGEMEFSDEVRIWSTIIQAKLYNKLLFTFNEF